MFNQNKKSEIRIPSFRMNSFLIKIGCNEFPRHSILTKNRDDIKNRKQILKSFIG